MKINGKNIKVGKWPYHVAFDDYNNKILDKKPEKLKDFDQIDINDSNMEYLIGIDYCSYRSPCKTIMGDRSYKITRKRYDSKVQRLDVYKEALSLTKSPPTSIKSDQKNKPDHNNYHMCTDSYQVQACNHNQAHSMEQKLRFGLVLDVWQYCKKMSS